MTYEIVLPILPPDSESGSVTSYNKTRFRQVLFSSIILAGQAVAVNMFVSTGLVVLYNMNAMWSRIMFPASIIFVALIGVVLLLMSLRNVYRHKVIHLQVIWIGLCLIAAVALATLFVSLNTL